MKICFKCSKKKEMKDFYRHSEMADGHLNKCKCCTKKDATAVRRKKIEYYREYDRSRSMLPHRVAAREEYQSTAQGKSVIQKLHKKWQVKNPVKRKAHIKVGNALRSGTLKKQPCENCGALKVHAHHDDYTKPLAVRWLCPFHHAQHHKLEEAA